MISSTITGNLGRDAEKRDVGDDTVISFSMASRRYDSKTKEEVADWVNVSYWGKRASAVAEYLTKGKTVAVRGNIWVREYTNDKTGKIGHSIECRADDVELLGGGADSDESESDKSKSQKPAPSAKNGRR
jgi:single-strand DNA-binding protein